MNFHKRFVIYAEGKLGFFSSKTGNSVVRYFPDRVVAVIDSTKAGENLKDHIGAGSGIPIVAGLDEALEYAPDALLLGSAPVGGRPDQEMMETVREAVCNGLDLVSGLHHFFSEMPEISASALEHGVCITDLRRVTTPLNVAENRWKDIHAKVVLTVGSDCNCGKLSTIYEIFRAFKKRDIPSDFIGTGQTGILLAGKGVAADAVVSDFVAGAVESEIVKSDKERPDYIFVEGQGALTHPAYSGVTMGLVHGTMPDAMIFCLDPTRKTDDWGNPIPDLKAMIDYHEATVIFFKESKVAGLGVITKGIEDESEAKEIIRRIESQTGLPANDPYRFGCDNLVEGLLKWFGVK